jgi:hypothetical protein
VFTSAQRLLLSPALQQYGCKMALTKVHNRVVAGAELNALDFGADPTGVSDSTSAIQAAIDVLKEKTYGGTLYLPEGDYSVSWLDLSAKVNGVFINDFKPTITIRGAGTRATRILGNTNGKNIIDALGRNFIRINDLTIGTKPGISVTCGLLLARETVANSCNNNQYERLNFEGVFSAACVVSIGAESSRWFGCRFENLADAGAKRCFWTSSYNGLSIVSETGGTIFEISANTDNRMFGSEFYNTQDGCSPVTFSRDAGYHFFGCLVVTGTRSGTVRLVTYDGGGTDTFSGPVQWFGCHFEGGGSGIVAHYFDCAGVLTYFHDIHFLSGTYVLFTGAKYFADYDRDGFGRSALRNCIVQTPRITTNLEFNATSVSVSDIDLAATNFSITANVSDFIAESSLKANVIFDPIDLAGCNLETFGTGVPASGTFAVGHVVTNSAPAVGVPMSWVCSALGTRGTLNGGLTTGSIVSGSNIMTVNTTSGMLEGHIISIAGVGVSFKVLKISGTSVTLSRVSGFTVSGAAVSFTTPSFLPSYTFV